MAIGTWFATDFDEVRAALDLPASVAGGQGPAVHLVDQVVRGVEIVGRVTGDSGAVAIRTTTTDHRVRVSVKLSLDDVATYWWADRVKPAPGTPERPRLVLVRSQGSIRGAAVLARRQGRLRARTAAATVEFDLSPADLAADGLLVVELSGPGPLPPWAAGHLSDRGAIGLRIDRITVTPVAPPPAPLPPSPVADDTGGGCRFVVAGVGEGVVRIALERVPPSPPVRRAPGNRWTRRRPARAAAKALRLARRIAYRAIAEATSRRGPGRPVPYGVDLATGEAVPVDVVGRDATGIDLRIAPAAGSAVAASARPGPVLIGLHHGPCRERTGRQLACTLVPDRPTAPHGVPE